jgi:hypothetical protein
MFKIFKKINNTTTDPDFEYLIKSAKRAKMAYLNPIEVHKLWKNKDEILCNALECPIYITNKEAQAYFWNEKIGDTQNMHITFRGTNTMQDIISDLNVRLVYLSDNKEKIQIHKGFYDQFVSIEPQITRLIENQDTQNLYISGHSLGAGIAQIAAAFYGEKNKEVSLCTIGCPRTGNDAFVKWLTQNIKNNIRIVNQEDIIPTIPIRPIWAHTNSILLKNNEYKLFPKEKKGITRWLRLLNTLSSNIDYDSPIKSHNCDNYIYNLSQCEKQNIK